MKNILILLSLLLLLSACHAKTDNPQSQTETPQTVDTPVVVDETPIPATPDPAPEAEKPVVQPEPAKPKLVTPLVTFIELGAESCIPCRMMQPIMKEIREEYKGLVNVIFIDLYKEKDAAQKYGIRVMPTQVFLDHQGREFFRHEGFYPKEEIEKMLAEKMGVNKPK